MSMLFWGQPSRVLFLRRNARPVRDLAEPEFSATNLILQANLSTGIPNFVLDVFCRWLPQLVGRSICGQRSPLTSER